MSTKLHHGYRLTVSPFVLIEQLHAALMPVRRRGYAQALAQLACLIHDEPLVHLPDEAEQRAPIIAAAHQLRLRQEAADVRGFRQPEADFNCDLTFLTDPRWPSDKYAILVTERDDYTAAWEALDGVHPWPYWNNADRPDGVTSVEWDYRRDVWARVAPAHSVTRRGLSWRFLAPHDRLPLADLRGDIATALPDRRGRARAVARQIVPGMHLVQGHLQLRDVDIIRAELDAETDRIASQLPDITVDDLYRRPVPAGGGPTFD